MSMWIIALICTTFLYSSAQKYDCNGNNPCGLVGFYSAQNGYQCYEVGNGMDVICTCPSGGTEKNKPCRPCNRTDPALNACQNTNGRLFACIETADFGTAYVCICDDGTGNKVPTTDPYCNTQITVTPRPTTTTATASTAQCLNGGVFVNNQCQCPSGFGGPKCIDKYDSQLCDRVNCKNNGTCAIRNPNGPYEAVCLCHYGTFGEYCELTGTLGYCSVSSCMNGGACRENVVGVTRHAYCYCPAGYNGPKCENRYFPCTSAGKFIDLTMYDQGKYIECTSVGGTFQATQRSCPRGLRFNQGLQLCTY